MKLDNVTSEELARALVTLDGKNPDEVYTPRGLTKGTPLWKLYGAAQAVELLKIIASARVDNTASVSRNGPLTSES